MQPEIQIGLTSTTLVTLPAPTSNVDIAFDYLQKETRARRTISNQLFVSQIGVEKIILSLNFEFKDKSTFDSLKAYCDGSAYWIRITDSFNTYFDGLAYLTLPSNNLRTRAGDQFRSFFEIRIEEK